MLSHLKQAFHKLAERLFRESPQARQYNSLIGDIMKFLKTILPQSPEYRALSLAAARHNTPAAVTGLSAVHKAHLVHTMTKEQSRRALLIAADEGEAQRLANDLCSMGTTAVVYPARDFNFRDTEGQSREYEHQRLHVLSRMLDNDIDVVITCADAALEYTIPPDVLRGKIITLRAGQEVALRSIVELLSSSGYERYDQVEGAGQFSVRGGILDFFTPDSSAPIRV